MDRPQQTDYVKVYRIVSDDIICNIIEKDLFSSNGYIFIKTENNMDVWYQYGIIF